MSNGANLNVCLAEEEHLRLRVKAAKHGLNMSEYVRRRLKDVITPETETEAD